MTLFITVRLGTLFLTVHEGSRKHQARIVIFQRIFTMPRPHKHKEREDIVYGARCRSLDERPIYRGDRNPSPPSTSPARRKRLKGSSGLDWEQESPGRISPALVEREEPPPPTHRRPQLTGDWECSPSETCVKGKGSPVGR